MAASGQCHGRALPSSDLSDHSSGKHCGLIERTAVDGRGRGHVARLKLRQNSSQSSRCRAGARGKRKSLEDEPARGTLGPTAVEAEPGSIPGASTFFPLGFPADL